MIFGISRLLDDLKSLGYHPQDVVDTANLHYAMLPGFIIQAGRFAGRSIDLAIPAPLDYGQVVGSSIHIQSDPVLYEIGNIPNVRNVTVSNLGPSWRYWSFQFKFSTEETTQYLMTQINTVLKDA